GGSAVERSDADQRRGALGAPRCAQGSGDTVAGDELAAADLCRGDVNILVGGIRRVDAQERGTGAEQLENTLGQPVLFRGAVRRGRLTATLLVRVFCGPAPRATPAGARATTRPVRARSVLRGLTIAGRLLRGRSPV